MVTHDGWAVNLDVRIHYLDSDPAGTTKIVSIVFVPDTLGAAEDYQDVIKLLAPRRCIAVSLRGRGKSDAPETGYGFADHVGDLEAVIEKTGLRDFCLMGYARGVPPTIEYAARYPERLCGLILADYPAHMPPYPANWAERMLAAIPEWSRPHVVHAVQRESEAVDLWTRLGRVECPVLVLRGGQKGSQLSVQDSTRYLQGLRNALVAVFEEAGHRLWEPSMERYINTLRAFLTQLDAINYG